MYCCWLTRMTLILAAVVQGKWDFSMFMTYSQYYCRSQWQRGLRRGSTAARLLWLWVRIPLAAWLFVCCECRVLSGRGLCDGLITCSEESYRLCCVVVCDLEELGGHDPRWVAAPQEKKTNTIEHVRWMVMLLCLLLTSAYSWYWFIRR